MTYEEWCEEELGYKCITTFFDDFSIAERFGEKAIEDTFNRAFENWKSNYKYLTELVMVLNHKMWFASDKGNNKLSRLYETLWNKADTYACTHLKDDELRYFYQTTD